MTLRLLGRCPSCNINDEIIEPKHSPEQYRQHLDDKVVYCTVCKTSWDNWLELTSFEREKGNRLIPVEVGRIGNLQVNLHFQSPEEIPFRHLVISMLNSALIANYNLEVVFCTEGGIRKGGPGGYELRNMDSQLGLYTHWDVESSADRIEHNARFALNFYERMMRQLFEEPLSFGNVSFRRGEILWLDEAHEEDRTNAMIYLFGTLVNVGNRRFAEHVLKTMDEVTGNPFSALYIRGLSAEEINGLFVPPKM